MILPDVSRDRIVLDVELSEIEQILEDMCICFILE